MKKMISLIVFLILSVMLYLGRECAAEVVLLGKASIPGDALDPTALSGFLEDGTPANRLGAFGSALAFTGMGNRYLVLPDRGPADGTTSYKNRYYEMDLMVSDGTVTASVVKAHALPSKNGKNFIGLSSAFDENNPCDSQRLDPEGIRLGEDDTVYISDEYGPCIHRFSFWDGRYLGSLELPAKFMVQKPNAVEKDELPPNNNSGRQPNRGMEGLAVSPAGDKLVGIMQSPLIEDNGLDKDNKRDGLNVRLVVFDLKNKTTHEFLYQLDDKKNGVNEILAVNDHEYLVIERDSTKGVEAKNKKIYKIDIATATDISNVASLPAQEVPEGITAVNKTLFIDLLNPQYGIAGADFPEKIEGLAFGPDFRDGRHLLVVSTDNDFKSDAPTYFFAFGIDSEDLPDFEPQRF